MHGDCRRRIGGDHPLAPWSARSISWRLNLYVQIGGCGSRSRKPPPPYPSITGCWRYRTNMSADGSPVPTSLRCYHFRMPTLKGADVSILLKRLKTNRQHPPATPVHPAPTGGGAVDYGNPSDGSSTVTNLPAARRADWQRTRPCDCDSAGACTGGLSPNDVLAAYTGGGQDCGGQVRCERAEAFGRPLCQFLLFPRQMARYIYLRYSLEYITLTRLSHVLLTYTNLPIKV